MTINEFIHANGMTMSVEWTDRNPSMSDSDNMDHWNCVIHTRGKAPMSLVFSMGLGHNGKKPKLAEVLDCLASDASGSDETFEDWCSDLGYDPDSRAAERTYNAVRQSTAKLRKLLGDDGMATLLDCERL